MPDATATLEESMHDSEENIELVIRPGTTTAQAVFTVLIAGDELVRGNKPFDIIGTWS